MNFIDRMFLKFTYRDWVLCIVVDLIEIGCEFPDSHNIGVLNDTVV